MKKALTLLLSKVIMGENLKMKTFKSFMKNGILHLKNTSIIYIGSILKKTPYELWKGNISYCYLFWIYSNASKPYRVYNSRTLSVEESIHVKFNDSKLGVSNEQVGSAQVTLLFKLEPKSIDEVLMDDEWIKAM
ncbi:hypothetical protein CR513_58724, partial [Mucuna pruriens]